MSSCLVDLRSRILDSPVLEYLFYLDVYGSVNVSLDFITYCLHIVNVVEFFFFFLRTACGRVVECFMFKV